MKQKRPAKGDQESPAAATRGEGHGEKELGDHAVGHGDPADFGLRPAPEKVAGEEGRAGSGPRPTRGEVADEEVRAESELRPTPEEVADEAVRYRRLQRAVDVSLALIYQTQGLTIGDSIEIVLHVRGIALELFPGSEETFDLLYRPRLMRAIRERFGIEETAELQELPE